MTPAELPAAYSGPPLRIAYVSNTRHSFCTEVHMGASLASLGHSVHFLQEDELDWSTVPALVEREGIQLLLWTRTWPAEMDVVLPVLKELEARGIVSASVHLDRWHGLQREHQVRDQPFFRTSLVVSPNNSPQWAEDGVNHFWLPPGVYGPECEPVQPNPRRWPFDVVFVGSHPYPHPEWAKYRSDLLAAFSRAFRGRFGILPRRGVPIRGRDLQELYATVPVVIGDSCLAGESFQYWSDRVPETLGRGGLLIHPLVEGMGPWYEGSELAETDPWPTDFMGYELGDYAEAVALAKWGIDNLRHRHEAKAIRDQGRATVLGRDTYAHRMGTVLAVAEGIHGGYRDVPEWERATPEVEREAGVSFSRNDAIRSFLRDNNYGRLTEGESIPCVPPPCPEPETVVLGVPSLRVTLNRWSAIFEPRPGTTDEEVCHEVWRNDYKVPPEGFRRGVVVDIGANIGAFAILAAKAGAEIVYAYEPEPENRARLEHHIKLNGVERQVKVLPLAVTDGAMPTVDMIGTGGGARIAEGGSVVTTTLAEVIAMHGPITYMKIDTEGSEGPMFAAVSAEDLAGVDRITCEFHGPDGPPGHPGAPHLAHLTGEEFGPLVTKLADAGSVETFGHPRRGGLIHWKRYGA